MLPLHGLAGQAATVYSAVLNSLRQKHYCAPPSFFSAGLRKPPSGRVTAVEAAVLTVAVEAAVLAIAAETTAAVAVTTVAAALTALLIGLGSIQGARSGAQGLGQDLALVDPHLHADTAVGGSGLSEAVVDVGAQGLQGDGALVIVLAAGDLSAAQTAGAAAP